LLKKQTEVNRAVSAAGGKTAISAGFGFARCLVPSGASNWQVYRRRQVGRGSKSIQTQNSIDAIDSKGFAPSREATSRAGTSAH
jgi:hypothetical protein